MSPAPYARVRQSAAAALYVRNRLTAEVRALGREVVRLRAAGSHAALGVAEDELRRAEGDLASAAREASEAMAALLAVHAELRTRARARLRGRAGDLAIEVAAEREVNGDALEERFRALLAEPGRAAR